MGLPVAVQPLAQSVASSLKKIICSEIFSQLLRKAKIITVTATMRMLLLLTNCPTTTTFSVAAAIPLQHASAQINKNTPVSGDNRNLLKISKMSHKKILGKVSSCTAHEKPIRICFWQFQQKLPKILSSELVSAKCKAGSVRGSHAACSLLHLSLWSVQNTYCIWLQPRDEVGSFSGSKLLSN